MEIFSLQSKKSLTAWSVGIGLLVFIAGSLITLKSYQPICSVSFLGICSKIYTFGYPWTADSDALLTKLPADLIFWILISFIVLFTIRHLRKKNYQISPRQN
jgi:hypothetical protein